MVMAGLWGHLTGRYYARLSRRRQMEARFAGARKFPSLAVQVMGGQVWTLHSGRKLGPLAGSHAAVVDASHQRIHGAVSLNPLPTRQRAKIRTTWQGWSMVTFRDGSVHQLPRSGGQFMAAQQEAVVFNTMAGQANPPRPWPSRA